MSRVLWSRLASSAASCHRQFPTFSLQTLRPGLHHLLNSQQNPLFPIQHRHLTLSQLQEKKQNRMAELRQIVQDNYRANRGEINWKQVSEELAAARQPVRANFEFTVMAAFSDSIMNDYQAQSELSAGLFQSISSFVGSSPVIPINRMAALRFARFLSFAPEFLTEEQLRFIRDTVDRVLGEEIKATQVVDDAFQALAFASPGLCRYASSRIQEFFPHSFNLKCKLVNLCFKSAVRFGVDDLIHELLHDYHQLINIDFNLADELMHHLAKKTSFADQPDRLLLVLNDFSRTHALVDHRSQHSLLDRILNKKLDYQDITPVQIASGGKCHNCGQHLPGLSMDEFSTLRQHFRSIIFDKNDEYLMSSLLEHEVQLFDFEEMIQVPGTPDPGQKGTYPKDPKYNLVIDCLNIAYRQGASVIHDKTGLREYSKVYKTRDLDHQLMKMLDQNRVKDRYPRILLIGRQHMHSWFQFNRFTRQNRDRADACLLINQTRDDNYILYAAVQHPGTQIVSEDYFRDHLEKFATWYAKDVEEDPAREKPNLPQIFRRWLKSRKIVLNKASQFVAPNSFDQRIHIHGDSSMHIPIVTKEDPFGNSDHEISWYCVRHGQRRPGPGQLKDSRDSRPLVGDS